MIPTIVTILVLGLCVLGISIKIWAKKDGKFSGTCSSQNPYLNQKKETASFYVLMVRALLILGSSLSLEKNHTRKWISNQKI